MNNNFDFTTANGGTLDAGLPLGMHGLENSNRYGRLGIQGLPVTNGGFLGGLGSSNVTVTRGLSRNMAQNGFIFGLERITCNSDSSKTNYMPIFTKTVDKKEYSYAKRVPAISLPELNSYLRFRTQRPSESSGDYGNHINKQYTCNLTVDTDANVINASYSSYEALYDLWNPVGVQFSNLSATTISNPNNAQMSVLSSRYGRQNRDKISIYSGSGHMIDIKNFWCSSSNDIDTSCNLFLILKLVEDIGCNYYSWKPHFCRSSLPSSTEMNFRDRDGEYKQGKVYHVGKFCHFVNDSSKIPLSKTIADSWYDVNEATKLNTMHIEYIGKVF